jgi:hypothetical protein
MSTPRRSPHTDPQSPRERVLAFAESELLRTGVPFDRLSYTPSSEDRYDGLVVVWSERRGRTLGVRLPEAA